MLSNSSARIVFPLSLVKWTLSLVTVAWCSPLDLLALCFNTWKGDNVDVASLWINRDLLGPDFCIKTIAKFLILGFSASLHHLSAKKENLDEQNYVLV
ncbi:hypothetical protein VNO80_21713 [Phaseolus coccineus]|uniref:Uncharacterized protein n=1 Tax=Phaseolus coccineus TaxID=3886 RepID=A0AAN9M4C4_PHACN